jgi:hypothetical protein
VSAGGNFGEDEQYIGISKRPRKGKVIPVLN